MRYITLLMLITLSGCTSREGQFYLQNETVYLNRSMYACYRGRSRLIVDERLAYCETATECQEICAKARALEEKK